MIHDDAVQNLRLKLVTRLVEQGYLKSDYAKYALMSVPREKFVNQAPDRAYLDKPLPIGYGQTISAPHMVAVYLEALELKSGFKVLEIGTGSGYHAAVTAAALKKLGGGKLYSIEIDERLYRQAKKNLEDAHLIEVVHLFLKDGFHGLKEFAPFDRIYLTAATHEKPYPLYEQLTEKGILLFPYGLPHEPQSLIKVTRGSYGFDEVGILECSFVPIRRYN